MDVVFINERHFYNGKEYYRIFLRPTLTFVNGKTFFDKVFQIAPLPFVHTMELLSGAGQFYIQTKNGTEIIKIGKTNLLEFSNLKIEQSKDGKFEVENFNFTQLDIPAELVEEQKTLKISYSATYNIKEGLINSHSISGTIKINRHFLTEKKYNADTINLTVANPFMAYIHMPLTGKKEAVYSNVLKNEIIFKTSEKFKNTIDPILNVESVYSWWDTNNKNLLGEKMKNYIESFIAGTTQSSKLTSVPKITSSFDFLPYYNVKKIKDKVTFNANKFTIENDNKTAFSFATNIVEESENGQQGIIWNPIFTNSVTYNRLIDFNGRSISIDYISEGLSNDIYNVNYSREEVLNQFSHILNFNLDEINKLGWKNKDKVVNYLNEKEEIL